MAQFLCLKNIRAFLATCVAVFELRETDLFQASMLYDYTDFARVLHTLSRLSNCAKAKSSKPQVEGFPRARILQEDNVKRRTVSGSAVPALPGLSTGTTGNIETSSIATSKPVSYYTISRYWIDIIANIVNQYLISFNLNNIYSI